MTKWPSVSCPRCLLEILEPDVCEGHISEFVCGPCPLLSHDCFYDEDDNLLEGFGAIYGVQEGMEPGLLRCVRKLGKTITCY